jgi:hypothetical protein
MKKILIIICSLILISSTIAIADPAISDNENELKDIQKNNQNTEAEPPKQIESQDINKQNIEAEPAKQTENTDLNKQNTETEPTKQIENTDINKQNTEAIPAKEPESQGINKLVIEAEPAKQADTDQSIKKDTQPVKQKAIIKYLTGLEIFFLPTVTFYNNAAGMDINFGIFTDMGLFGLTGYKKNIVLGGSGLWHRVSKNNTTVSTFGVYGIAGYQFFLRNYVGGLPWYEDVRFMVQSRIGVMNQNISGEDKSNGAAAFITPALTADIKFTDIPLRLGVDVSYNIYLGNQNLRSVSMGIYVSYKF